ncbi:MAG: CRISPR-associated endonuclease Cas2 [Parahaliea sp.]
MPLNRTCDHIIAYDIASPRRLGKVHRYLKKCAVPIQYSVFLTRCTTGELKTVISDIEKLINPLEDDVRFYTLPYKARILTAGQQGWPAGVFLLAEAEEGKGYYEL